MWHNTNFEGVQVFPFLLCSSSRRPSRSRVPTRPSPHFWSIASSWWLLPAHERKKGAGRAWQRPLPKLHPGGWGCRGGCLTLKLTECEGGCGFASPPLLPLTSEFFLMAMFGTNKFQPIFRLHFMQQTLFCQNLSRVTSPQVRLRISKNSRRKNGTTFGTETYHNALPVLPILWGNPIKAEWISRLIHKTTCFLVRLLKNVRRAIPHRAHWLISFVAKCCYFVKKDTCQVWCIVLAKKTSEFLKTIGSWCGVGFSHIFPSFFSHVCEWKWNWRIFLEMKASKKSGTRNPFSPRKWNRTL